MDQSSLPLDWVVRPAIDLELKQYTLLAYLQRVKARFSERKLYPHLHEIQEHILELQKLRDAKEHLLRSTPGDLIGFDPRTGKALIEHPESDPVLSVIDELIEFAVPGLRRALTDGSELREELAGLIRFEPIGLLPLHAHEGWLVMRTGNDARVYGYHIPMLRSTSRVLDIVPVRTSYVISYTVGISCTYEHIKADLICNHRSLPNPATFIFESTTSLPYIETFIPLAKQLVYEHITSER